MGWLGAAWCSQLQTAVQLSSSLSSYFQKIAQAEKRLCFSKPTDQQQLAQKVYSKCSRVRRAVQRAAPRAVRRHDVNRSVDSFWTIFSARFSPFFPLTPVSLLFHDDRTD